MSDDKTLAERAAEEREDDRQTASGIRDDVAPAKPVRKQRTVRRVAKPLDPPEFVKPRLSNRQKEDGVKGLAAARKNLPT